MKTLRAPIVTSILQGRPGGFLFTPNPALSNTAVFATLNDMTAKTKTSVSLSPSLLAQLAPYTGSENTTQLVEKALVYYLAKLKRQASAQRDTAIINAHAPRLSREAKENLSFQDIP